MPHDPFASACLTAVLGLLTAGMYCLPRLNSGILHLFYLPPRHLRQRDLGQSPPSGR